VVTYKKFDILFLDGVAGLLAGLTLFSFQGWFHEVYSLPLYVLQFITAANMLYGALALLLASKRKRGFLIIKLLALANTFWTLICICFIFIYLDSASWKGISLLILESLFVGYLAYYEWVNRNNLIYSPTYKKCVKTTHF
jgi:hypothetical protein|tara:strand:+ start:119 stop:538 length:420 start_codon:yes stop_codon:yes gene_type:complete